jgi:hypothetical protein
MIFFLDMDGVLNNMRVCTSLQRENSYNNFGWIDPICVNYINRWAKMIKDQYQDDTDIVLSSTWRGAHDGHSSLSMMFGAMGLSPLAHKDFKTRPTGMTIDGVNDIRGNQIADWLTEHPEEKHWVIIDDDSDFTEEQRPRHIHTDTYNGILFQNHIDFETMLPLIYEGKI